MRYLLVGNGPATDIENKARHAESIIQINHCEHRAKISPEKMSYVVLVNTADPKNISNILNILKGLDLPAHTRILLSRNHLFYKLKGFAAWLKNASIYQHFTPFPIDYGRPTESVPFFASCRLEYKLLTLGMRPSFMPSTGMVAYYWLSTRMKPGDSLDIAGFTFEGWGRHPWHIEKGLIKGIYPPGYRDDPSYEKRLIP